jgi:hypothetical protein
VEARPGGDVLTSYRAYAQDQVVELWHVRDLVPVNTECDKGTVVSTFTPELVKKRHYNWVPVDIKVRTYTLDSKSVLKRHTDGPRAGLPMIPSGSILPMAFAKGRIDPETGETSNAWEQLTKVLNFARRKWAHHTDVRDAPLDARFPSRHLPRPSTPAFPPSPPEVTREGLGDIQGRLPEDAERCGLRRRHNQPQPRVPSATRGPLRISQRRRARELRVGLQAEDPRGDRIPCYHHALGPGPWSHCPGR